MPEIKSPITNRQFQSPPTRDFSVPDESGYTPPQPPLPPPPQHRHQQQEPVVFDQQAMRDFQASMQPQGQPFQMRELNDVERKIHEAKKAKREGKERLSDGARRRIEMLVEMTKLTKDIGIDGNVYRIQTLTSREFRDAIASASEFDGTVEFIFEYRKQLLARALVIVAGVEISQFLNSVDIEDRLEFIELMDHALLLRLYNEYNTLAKDSNDKYALKTEAQVKEVLEDLKK